MRAFAYGRAADSASAIRALQNDGQASFVAGGTNIIDLTKIDVELPATLIDINALPYAGIGPAQDGGFTIGALARMSDVADHPEVKAMFPALSEALNLSASPQLRNMASIGGNIMQRTRCSYFRDTATRCNKRSPGSGCTAIGGENRWHGVLGTSDHCICTNPSDFAVALHTADATVLVSGPNGDRRIPFGQFHVLPGNEPQRETTLAHGELITGISVAPSQQAKNSTYLKIRDRQSYEFALISVAAGLDVVGGVIRAARVGIGGVAPAPWRSHEAEAALVGKPATRATYVVAADHALRDAKPQSQNAFKIELAKRAVVRALSTVGGVA